MSLDALVLNDYGQVLKLTYIDVDTDAAADISAYSGTISMVFTDPAGVETTVTAAFDSDGTDGIIKYTIASGLLDTVGQWTVRGKVINTGVATFSTLEGEFDVNP